MVPTVLNFGIFGPRMFKMKNFIKGPYITYTGIIGTYDKFGRFTFSVPTLFSNYQSSPCDLLVTNQMDPNPLIPKHPIQTQT